MLQSLEYVAVMAGLFLLVPAVVWISTGSLRSAVEAAKGYGMIWLILGVIPGVIGLAIAGLMLLGS